MPRRIARRRRHALPLAVGLVLIAGGESRAQRPATGAGGEGPAPACAAGESQRQLAFLLGEWRVTGGDGKELGKSVIELGLGGCLFEERYVDRSGGESRSLLYFDPAAGRLRLDRFDSFGSVGRFSGRFDDGALHLRGEQTSADGTVTVAQMHLELREDGRLHHRIEHATADGGWLLHLDALYLPVGSAVAAVAEGAAPEARADRATAKPESGGPPRPARSEEGSLRALSAPLPSAEIPPDAQPRIVMASPMTLALRLGPIDRLPAGTEWSSRETELYVCNQVSIRRVAVSKREKRGDVLLELSVSLEAERLGRSVELTLELLAEDERVVGEARIDRINLGRLVSAYDRGTELKRSTTLRLSAAEFAALFGSDRRPILRITASVS